MKDTAVARRYARAFFEEAQARKQALACRQGLEEIMRVARYRSALRDILAHPLIALKEKQAMIRAALGEYATPLLERFLTLLVEKKRFGLLPSVVEEFQAQVDRSQNVQAVAVTTAYPLPESERRALQKRLETWLHSNVRMQVDRKSVV